MENETINEEILLAIQNCSTGTDYSYVQTFFPLLYGIPTVFLTILLVALIVKDTTFHTVFFFQFVAFGMGNILYWLSSILLDKVMLIPVTWTIALVTFWKGNILLQLLYWVYCYGVDSYFWCTLSITLWRVIVIFRAPYNEEVSFTTLRAMFITQLLLPFSLYWIYLNTDVIFTFYKPGTPRIMFFARRWPDINASGVSGPKFALLSLFVICASIYMIKRVLQIWKSGDRKAERNIIITCLAFTVPAMSISLYQGSIYYFTSVSVNLIMTSKVVALRAIVIDLAALAPTWLLFTSSKLRQKLFKTAVTPSNPQSTSRMI